VADLPDGLHESYERRSQALSSLAALDRRVMASVWQSGDENVIEYLERVLINLSVDAKWAANVVGVWPKPLPGSGPSGNDKAPSAGR
jgi:hypothetical protein